MPRRPFTLPIFAAALCLAWVALAVGCHRATPAQVGERREVVLRNGASLEAPLLRRDGDRMLIDLGYTVLSVPRDQVAVERAPGGEGEATSPSLDLGASGRLGRLGTIGDGGIREIVDELKQAVVIVSNPRGLGAGFVIDPAGLVVTNYHVVRGEKENNVTVFLRGEDGKLTKKIFRGCEVRAFSSLLDCALVAIPPEQLEDIALEVLDLASPDSIRVGMPVYALGNPGVGTKVLEHTLSEGILSSSERNFNDVLYLQTTAAVNPGNSGGPLLNRRGEVIGLVTFRAVFQEGLAFALPVWYLWHFVEHARAYAPSRDSASTGYRYHDPGEPVETP